MENTAFEDFISNVVIAHELFTLLEDSPYTLLSLKHTCRAARGVLQYFEQCCGTLLTQQIPHFLKLKSIFARERVALDPSPMGSGKTRVAVYLASRMNLSLFVICPRSAETIWWEEVRRYDAPFVCTITSDQLSRSTSKELTRFATVVTKHKAIAGGRSIGIVGDEDRNTGDRDITVDLTMYFRSLLDSGILIAVDEAHTLQNNIRGEVVFAMIQAIMSSPDTRSRVLLLSGTAFVRRNTVGGFLRLMGLVKVRTGNFSGNSDHWSRGLAQLYESLFYRNLITGPLITGGSSPSAKTDNVVTRISAIRDWGMEKGGYVDVLTHYLSMDATIRDRLIVQKTLRHCLDLVEENFISVMIPPVRESMIVIKNILCDLDPSNLSDYCKAVSTFENLNRDKYRGAGCVLRDARASLSAMETAILPSMERVATKLLQTKPNCKVILLLNETKHLDILMSKMRAFVPLQFSGGVDLQKRHQYTYTFQTNSDRRLIIGLGTTIGTAVSLHDVEGDSPRYMLISPHFSIAQRYQSIGRITRLGMQTTATIWFMYANHCDGAIRVIDTIARSERHDQSAKGVEGDIRLAYPSEHGTLYEKQLE